MISSGLIVHAARGWMNTPFQHQGRLKHVGVDCIGLIIGVGKELGIWPENFDYVGYGRDPSNGVLLREVEKHCIATQELQAGTILLMRWFAEPQHVAIHCGDVILHSAYHFRGVVEHRYSEKWKKRTTHIFRFPRVTYG